MPFKMTCEPDDYEGPWPSEDAMTKPQQAEPVAWRYIVYGDMVLTRSRLQAQHAAEDGFDVDPLYLHPPPAEVQQAEPVLLLDQALSDESVRRVSAFAQEHRAEVHRLREALHQISLCSQNSMSSKDECGRIARRALEGK